MECIVDPIRWATLGDTLAELAPVEQVTRCQDCPCCFVRVEHTGRGSTVVLTRCADNPELELTDLRIRHPECKRIGMRTEWPA